MAARQLPLPLPERWVRADDFARRSGFSERTIRRWCASGVIPASRRGGLKLWWVDTLELRALRRGGIEHMLLDGSPACLLDAIEEDDAA